MAKFSDRMGLTQPVTQIQIDAMNESLRMSLWNWIVDVLRWDGGTRSVPMIWQDYFKRPADIISVELTNWTWLREYFGKGEWYDAYNLVEFVAQNISQVSSTPEGQAGFVDKLNLLLERELSGYRFISKELVPITDTHEIESIRQALQKPESLTFNGPSQHIEKALSLLGKKPDPDYANSIKESMSAVESMCKLMTGEKSGALDKALAKLSSQINIHPALKKAFSNLYGYTSDEDGIRHAILESKDIGFAEAKFMLVTCSAFINFVIDKSRSAALI